MSGRDMRLGQRANVEVASGKESLAGVVVVGRAALRGGRGVAEDGRGLVGFGFGFTGR